MNDVFQRPIFRVLAALLFVPFGLGAVGCQGQISDGDIRPITLAELSNLRRRDARDDRVLLLIDPRSRESYERGHIPGARNIRLPDIDDRFGVDPAINRHEAIVVYGDNPASASARGMTKRLLSIGYKSRKVWMYMPGLAEWVDAALPVETGPDPESPEPPDGQG